jgi:hypothetical protein
LLQIGFSRNYYRFCLKPNIKLIIKEQAKAHIPIEVMRINSRDTFDVFKKKIQNYNRAE